MHYLCFHDLLKMKSLRAPYPDARSGTQPTLACLTALSCRPTSHSLAHMSMSLSVAPPVPVAPCLNWLLTPHGTCRHAHSKILPCCHAGQSGWLDNVRDHRTFALQRSQQHLCCLLRRFSQVWGCGCKMQSMCSLPSYWPVIQSTICAVRRKWQAAVLADITV